MFCMECGTKLPEGAKFCFNCGTKTGEAASAAPAEVNRGCTPGKKYEVFKLYQQKDADEEKWGDFAVNEVGEEDFYCGYYTRLDDGTAVGWVYGHISKYAEAEDFFYNLYRADRDGTAQFLGAGCRSGIENMYVQDGYVYWNDGDKHYRTGIYDDSPEEKID